MGNRLVNFTTVKQGLYAISETPNGDIGSVMEFEDGRRFVYSKAGEELTLSVFCQGPVEDSSGDDEELVIPTDHSVVAGDKTITITTQRAWDANELQDGYLVIDYQTADIEGAVRKIKYHPAAEEGASCVITVYDAFVTAAVYGAETITVIKNPYGGVMEVDSTTTGPLLGLPTMTVTSGYYFWLQVAGIAAVATGEASLIVGDWVCVDATNGTAMMMDTAGDNQLIGVVMNTCDTQGNICFIMLQLGR